MNHVAAAAPGTPVRPPRSLTALLTCAMACSMMQLFLLGALGPRLVADLGVSPGGLGLAVTLGFGAAAVLSPVGGRVVDRVGPRACLTALFLVSAVALTLIGAAPGPGFLLGAVALGGLPQALANPATNRAILAAVHPERRGAVTGLKQSGVQWGAFAAGLPLAALAGPVGWRPAVWLAAVAALGCAIWALWVLPPDPAPRAGAGTAGGAGAGSPAGKGLGRGQGGDRTVPWLAAFSVLLGCGIASVNTYAALYGTERLGFGPTAAGALVAVLGLAGIAGRIGWSRIAGRPDRAVRLPGALAVGAVGATALLGASDRVPVLVWAGVLAMGGCAVAGNAVSMVLVMQRAAPGRAGQDSALVSAGFFAGFALGPPLFGLLADAGRYGAGWLLVAAEFAAAAAIAGRWATHDRRARAHERT